MTSFKTSASASSSVSSGVVVVSHPVGSMGEVWHSQVHTFNNFLFGTRLLFKRYLFIYLFGRSSFLDENSLDWRESRKGDVCEHSW